MMTSLVTEFPDVDLQRRNFIPREVSAASRSQHPVETERVLIATQDLERRVLHGALILILLGAAVWMNEGGGAFAHSPVTKNTP